MTNDRKLTPHDILRKPYTRKLTPDPSGGFVAAIHEFPGCIAYGATADEAINKLESAAESWLEAAVATDYEIQEPANYESSSGRIALRISRRLHQLAAERAEREGTSLNQFIAVALANYLGQQGGIDRAISAAKEQLYEVCSHIGTNVSQQALSNLYLTINQSHSLIRETSARPFIKLPKGSEVFRQEASTREMTPAPLL